MSDSDDTDILLLIPPNFFLTETHLNDSPNYEMFRSTLEHRSIKPILSPRKSQEKPAHNHSMNILLSQSKDLLSTPSQMIYRPYHETSPTVNISNFNRSFESLNCISSNDVVNAMCEESEKVMANRRSSSPLGRTPKSNAAYMDKEYSSERIGNLSSRKMSDWKTSADEPRNHDDNLISMTNVWNHNLDFKPTTTSHSTELEEERLRRRQCERNISHLQSQLNHYQNKFTDVIKMDQAKNDTLTKLHNTNSSLIANVSELERRNAEMELRFHRERDQLTTENIDLRTKVDHLKQQNIELERKINSILQ